MLVSLSNAAAGVLCYYYYRYHYIYHCHYQHEDDYDYDYHYDCDYTSVSLCLSVFFRVCAVVCVGPHPSTEDSAPRSLVPSHPGLSPSSCFQLNNVEASARSPNS
jgi:hypothetical protein